MADAPARSVSSETTGCDECGVARSADAWRAALWICPACHFPNSMPVLARLELLADPGSLGSLIIEVAGSDPLRFVDQRSYPERLAQARSQTGMSESFVAAPATVGNVRAIVGAFEFSFMGGTMSLAAGERVARVFEQAADEGRAVVLAIATGGARMQEGTLALFQMTKTVAALSRFRRCRLPYIAVFCHPTLGGVSASFASLADVILAEPRARVGFAGPRVIEQLLGHKLPADFQRAEFVLEHGFIDRVVPREQLSGELAVLLPLLSRGGVA